jgi:hypothetical protein
VLLLLTSIAIHGDGLFPFFLLATGLGALVIAVFGEQIRTMKVAKDGVSFETHPLERDSSSRLALPETTADEVAEEISSDEEVPPTPSPQDADIIGYLNFTAGSMAMESLFERFTVSPGPLNGCKLRLYLPDDAGILVPALEDGSAASSWPPGRGATGVAYATREFVLASEEAVWDETFGLTSVERERYKELFAVASNPVWDSEGVVVGVITASTNDPQTGLTTDEARVNMNLLALLASRILIELLEWFD